MRKTMLLLSLAASIAASSPSWAAAQYRRGPLAEAALLIERHHLLTPDQLACSELVRGPEAIGEAAQVIVLVKQGAPCAGQPGPAVRLFDIFLDNRSGAAYWNGDDRLILSDIPADPAAPRPFCLPAGPCLDN